MSNHPNSLANLKPIQPGEVRNKQGRTPGTLNSKTILARLLKNKGEYTHPTTGKVYRMPKLALMYQKQIDMALAGSTMAFNAVVDRYEGKPEQKQNLAFEEGAAEITVRIGKASD